MPSSLPAVHARPVADTGRERLATNTSDDSIYAEIDLRVFTVISLGGSFVAGLLGLRAANEGRWLSSTLILTIAVCLAINLLVARRFKAPVEGLNVLAVIATVAVIGVCATAGIANPPAMILLAGVPFAFAISGALRSMITWLVIEGMVFVLIYFLPSLKLPIPAEPYKNLPLIFGIEVAMLALFVAAASYTAVRGRRALLEELTRAKIDVEHARDEAIKANDAKSQFLARVSHELRTPLNGIIGFANILTSDRQNPLNAQQRERLHLVEASGQSLLALVNEILDITQIESGEMNMALGPLAVDDMLRETTGAIEPLAHDAAIVVSVQAAQALWVVADEQRLRQALANLLSNAIKYNRPQGTVVITATANDHEVKISVRDSGPGLRAEEIARLFQPFNRLGAANGNIEGSGLGLVITRTLVERMLGRIEVESNVGSGSCFSIILPRHAPPGSPGISPAQTIAIPSVAAPAIASAGVIAGHAPDAGIRTVLYVEDNPVNVLLMEAMFERLPLVRLHIATTGEEGLAAAQALRPDLLLLDINLPDCLGIELLAQIRALGSITAPAIAVSADAMPDAIQRALDCGFQEYWTKPLNMPQKLQSLSVMLATPKID